MNSEGLESFNLALHRFGHVTVPDELAKAGRKIALSVLRGVIWKTPVRTGRARSNWSVTLDKPSGAEINGGGFDSPAVGGQAETVIASLTLAKGESVIRRWNPEDVVLWIENNVPYIESLENGHSRQAPAGMLKLTLNEVGG